VKSKRKRVELPQHLTPEFAADLSAPHISAKLTHDKTARNIDPHLGSHCLISSVDKSLGPRRLRQVEEMSVRMA